MVTVELVVERAGSTGRGSTISVPSGTRVRDVLRRADLAPEGSAVLENGVPIPLDSRVERDVLLTVLPTFSGG